MRRRDYYFTAVHRPYPPLLTALIYKGMSQRKYYYPFFKNPKPVQNIASVEGNWFFVNKEIEANEKAVVKEWNSAEKIKQVMALYEKLEKEFIDSTRKSFPEFARAFEAYMPSMVPVYASDKPVFKKLKTLLTGKIGTDQASEILDVLNLPFKSNFFKQEEYDLLHAKDLRQHVQQYEWLISRYGQKKPYTFAMARRKLRQINKKEYVKKWNQEKKEILEAAKRAKKIVGPKNEYLVDFLQFIVHYRTQRTDVINKCAYLYIPGFKKLAKSLGLTYEQLRQLTQDEILNREIPPKKEINDRIRESATVMESGSIKVVSGPKLKKLKKFFKDDVKDQKEFKGEIACKGYVKGRVVVLVSGQNLSKVQKGDIIVASMTTPDMVPAMKKAAAFVTNEGGITCHAAIVSREMKKPCVIGTKIATKVLKDGDLVEVDANKGIVKKI